MIIKEVKSNKRLFFEDQVVVVTDKKKISFDAGWDENLISKLNSKLKDFKIESGNDFVYLKEKLKDLDQEKYIVLENAILDSIDKVWKFFNPDAKQVPRPMNTVFSKEKGIKEFVVFSLNARNFPIALDANRHVADRLAKKIKDENLSEGDILMLVKEAVDEEHALVDFEIRLGVVFDNYKKGEYIYLDKSLTSEEQLEFVSKLIDKHSLVYVENPFFEDDLVLYKRLYNKYRKKGLICMNSNNYKDVKAFNCVVAKFNNVADFKIDVDFFKDKKLNIIVEGKEDAMNVSVGLGIPLVKLTDDKVGNATAKKLNKISEEIVSERKS